MKNHCNNYFKYFGLLLVLLLAACSSQITSLSPYTNGEHTKIISSAFNYKINTRKVFGSQMAYVDIGNGDPILFLHGVPTSSYLWRNIMPHLENQARLIAVDLIGFGQSEKPDIEFTYSEHYRYLSELIKQLDLKNITLVVHDWGSGLGLNYAYKNPDNIKAIVTMESILAPIMPAESYSDLTKGSERFFRTVRDPIKGKKLILEDNYFIETVLPNSIIRPLDETAHNVYRAPFKTVKSRQAIYKWPQHMPIEQQPQHMHQIVSSYNRWLEQMDKPWLLFYSSPGALNPPGTAQYWKQKAKNIEIVNLGKGSHYLQEDHPHKIGQNIAKWYKNIQ